MFLAKPAILFKEYATYGLLVLNREIREQVGPDIRTTVGGNLKMLAEETGLDVWKASPGQLRKELMEKSAVEVPLDQVWRIQYLRRLLESRLEAYYMGWMDKEEDLTRLINSLCVN